MNQTPKQKKRARQKTNRKVRTLNAMAMKAHVQAGGSRETAPFLSPQRTAQAWTRFGVGGSIEAEGYGGEHEANA